MKKIFGRLALIALPSLFAAACGGDLFDLPDAGTDAGAGACPTGTVIYRVANGTYNAVAGSASVISDPCKTGLTPAMLEGQRAVGNDGQGNVTLYASDGSTIISTGPLRCNRGTLKNGPVSVTDGKCRFTANYTTDFTINSDNNFTVQITQDRSNTMVEQGMTCNQPPTCSFVFKVTHKL
jgi:hypothetical protein